jgi:hypothetical protein
VPLLAMPHVLVHAAAVDDLAAAPKAIPADLAEALQAHRPYGRFGALLPDLPWFALPWRRLVGVATRRAPAPPPFATLLHNGAPVALGLRLAELVAGASLVGRGPGLALVAGYFSHLALDRSFHPPVVELVRREAAPGESLQQVERRIEWQQALFFLRRREGRDVLGWSALPERLQVVKRQGFPLRGVGRGIGLLVRTACQDTLGVAPTPADLDGWVRGLYLYGRALGGPLGRRFGLPTDAGDLRGRIYRGEVIDFDAVYLAAVERARHHLRHACRYLTEADFGLDARRAFFEDVPEGAA